MDRRYLLATLALAATFAVCSHEMRGGRLVVMAGQRLGAIAGRCGGVSSAPARIVSEMRDRLRPGRTEEAQMLAEMNLPMLRAQAVAAATAARQEMQEAKCARDAALHQAELARREAQRARQDARRVRENVTFALPDTRPIVLRVDALPQIQQHIQIKSDMVQSRVAVPSINVEISTDQMNRINEAMATATANLDRAGFAMTTATSGATAWKCKTSNSWSQQMRTRYGNAVRTLQSIHNSLNVTNVHQGSGSSL